MKKLFLTLVMLVMMAGAAFADSFSRDVAVLPAPARTMIEKNFNSNVSVVKIDKELGRVSEYEVIMTDGAEVSFDARGNWKDVEMPANKAVPAGFVLKPIKEYVAANHSDSNIVGIDKNAHNIEVTLANGIEMKFSNTGKFMHYDD